MSTVQIAPGDIIAGLEPDEHVEVTKVTAFGNRTLVEGVGVTTRRVVRRPLTSEEVGRLGRIRGSSHTYDGDPSSFLLGVEAHRIKTAYQFDPLFAVNSSAVDVLPHQIEAVYRYMLPLPRIRFLLADDTGAGKTIMAGLLLKELLFRGTVTKVLIVVPGGLTRQWVEDEMKDKFGLPFRLINVIDELLEQVPLVELIEKSIDADALDAAQAVAQEARQEMDDPGLKVKARELVALQKKTSLASRLDLGSARQLRDSSDERRLQPLFMQNLFLAACRAAGGTVRADEHFPVFHVGPVPTDVRDVARPLRLPLADKYDYPFVFDKQLVSVASRTRVPEHTKLLGSGHPLFDAVTEWAIRQARDAFSRGATVCDPNIAARQRLWLVRSAIEDGRQEARKRLAHQQLAVVLADHHGLRSVSPATLLNFTAPDSAVFQTDVPDRSSDEIQMWAFENVTEPQLKQVEGHRHAECDLRRQYLDTTFTELIGELQTRLEELQRASLYGNDDPIERENLENRLRKLKERKKRRVEEIDLMLRLTANLPDVLTAALVVPAPVASVEGADIPPGGGFPMRRDDEVEQIAMNVVMRFEQARGWTPQDVSKDGEHYDIRSEGPDAAKRYIEVKGRAQSGAVVLTAPEVDKLRQLGDRAFLYIVTFCKGEKPKLKVIQDPMSSLHPKMLYRQVQFMVDEADWKQQGEDQELPLSGTREQ
jgi:hypothetical protein